MGFYFYSNSKTFFYYIYLTFFDTFFFISEDFFVIFGHSICCHVLLLDLVMFLPLCANLKTFTEPLNHIKPNKDKKEVAVRTTTTRNSQIGQKKCDKNISDMKSQESEKYKWPKMKEKIITKVMTNQPLVWHVDNVLYAHTKLLALQYVKILMSLSSEY